MTVELHDFSAGYGGDSIVHRVDIPIPDAEIGVLIGPNGAGKSTILKALFGVASVNGGTVTVDGAPCHPIGATQLLKRGVTYVPQLRNVFAHLTVLENLDMGLGGGRGESVQRVLALFPDLGPLLRRPAGKLSGGERNMVALGRALMGSPRTLLIDEGSAGLAPKAAQRFWEHLRTLAATGVGILVVEQDVRLALKYADNVHLLRYGEIALSGKADSVGTAEALGALFLGQEITARG